MTGKTRRIERISRSLEWGVLPDPEREFWRCGEAWSVLGALAGYPPSWRVYCVRLLESGRINRLKALFVKAGSSLNEQPTQRQLDWACRALEKVAPSWKESAWWEDGELELDHPSAWLSGLFSQALEMLDADRLYIKDTMHFTKGAKDFYRAPWILANDMQAQEVAFKLIRLLGKDNQPENLKELRAWLIQQKESLEVIP